GTKAGGATLTPLPKNPSPRRVTRSTTATPLALPVFSSTTMWRTIELVRSVQCFVAMAAGSVDDRELNIAPTEHPLPQLPQKWHFARPYFVWCGLTAVSIATRG